MLITYPVAGKQKAIDLCNAFVAGAPRSAQGAVFYGVNETNVRQWREAQRSGKPWYFIDNSYFDSVRGQQFRVTKNRVQISCHGRETDGARFAALGLQIEPMRDAMGLVLAVAQSTSFMVTVARDPDWLLRRTPNEPYVRLRPWLRDKAKASRSLVDDLAQARRVITHSSAAAVEALLRGIPVAVSEMSACHGWTPDNREHLFGVLADNQFTIDEMKDGTAWAALNK